MRRQWQRHEEQKSSGFRRKWSVHTWPRHHLLVPSQYMRGGPWVKAIRGCSLTVGRNGSLFWGFRSNFFEEKCPTRMTFHPKEVSMSWNHWMHAIDVGEGEV